MSCPLFGIIKVWVQLLSPVDSPRELREAVADSRAAAVVSWGGGLVPGETALGKVLADSLLNAWYKSMQPRFTDGFIPGAFVEEFVNALLYPVRPLPSLPLTSPGSRHLKRFILGTRRFAELFCAPTFPAFAVPLRAPRTDADRALLLYTFSVGHQERRRIQAVGVGFSRTALS